MPTRQDIERLRLIATSPTVSTITPDSADLVWVYDVDLNRVVLSTAADVGAVGSAPVGATFITQTPNATLTNEQAMSALATGLVKNTTGTGVQSIAVAGTDYEQAHILGGNDRVLTSGGAGLGAQAEANLTFDSSNRLRVTGKIGVGQNPGNDVDVKSSVNTSSGGLRLLDSTTSRAITMHFDSSVFGVLSCSNPFTIRTTGIVGDITLDSEEDVLCDVKSATNYFRVRDKASAATRFQVTGSGVVLQNTTTAPTGTVVGTFQQGVQAGNPTPAANAACWFGKDVSAVATPHVVDEGGTVRDLINDYALKPSGSNNQVITDNGFGGLVSEPNVLVSDNKLGIGVSSPLGLLDASGTGNLAYLRTTKTVAGGDSKVVWFTDSGGGNYTTSLVLQNHDTTKSSGFSFRKGTGSSDGFNFSYGTVSTQDGNFYFVSRVSSVNTNRVKLRPDGIFEVMTNAILQNGSTAPTGTIAGTFQQGVQAGNPTPATNAACWFVKDVSTVATGHLVNENGDIWSFAKQTALTAQLTTITHTAPGTPDYALQDLVDSGVGSAWGFATKDEGNTLLSVVKNLQARVAELESKLQTIGALA